MPHCILEYSNNIKDGPTHLSLLKQIHKTLFATGLFDLQDIKSRVLVHDKYLVGDGTEEWSFVALTVEILSGRDEQTKEKIAKACLKILEEHFLQSMSTQKFSLTVQIREIDKPSYSKIKTY